jgi:hypothetical protein
MTPNNTTTTPATNGHSTERNKAARGSKARKRGASGETRRSQGESSGTYSATASRLMSQGKQALGDAYGWASEGAGRAFPRASDFVPDRRALRNMLEERPLVLGAIGLGLGAMIGMMLPSRFMGGNRSGRGGRSTGSSSGRSSGASAGRSSSRSRRSKKTKSK